MSDRHHDHDAGPDPDAVRAAFDRLRTDAHEVDTMAALRRLDDRRRPRWAAPGILGAAAAAVLIIVGLAIWRGGDDGPAPDQVAAGDPTAQPDVTAQPGDGAAASLDGTSWSFVSGTAPDGRIEPAAGFPVTLSFDGDRATGNAGCNAYAADIVWDGERARFVVGDMQAEGCDADIGDADAAQATEGTYVDALNAVTDLAWTDTELTLSGPGVELFFDRLVDTDVQPGPGAQSAWELVAGVGPDGDIPIIAGWPITLTLEGDRIGGTAACNGYGGRLVTEGETVTVVDLGSEAALCGTGDGGIMVSERLFLEALQVIDTVFRNEAELILTGPDTELIFNAVAGVPTAELVGRLWLLDRIIEGEAATAVLGDPATLLLNPDGTFEAGTGCRTLTGAYVISGASVIATNAAAAGECPADVQTQDGFVITVLTDGFVPTIEADRLTLTSQGNQGLSYVAIDDVPDFEPTPAVTLEELVGSSWSLSEGVGPAGQIIPGAGPLLLRFGDTSIGGDAPCNSYGASFELAGSNLTFGPIEGEQQGCDETDVEERFFSALAGVARIELHPGQDGGARFMVLIGPDVDLLFEEVTGDGTQGRTPLTVSELLDTRPTGPQTVIGNLWFRGGSWILCETLSEDSTPFCAGRWVTLTNYDDLVDPHTDPPTGITEAAVSLADVNESFATDGTVVWTPQTTAITVRLTDDGRGVIPEFPDPTVLVEEEIALLDAFVTAGGGAPFDRTALRLADAVVVGLSDRLIETRTAAELEDRSSWELDLEAFRGWVGPFSALDLLAQASDGRRAVSFSAGRQDHCASPPAPIAPGLEGARQLHIQPTGIDSCLQWWTVDIFVDAAGQVIGITLDLWEP